MNPGKSIAFMNYADPQGVEAEFVRKPGEELYRYSAKTFLPPMQRVATNDDPLPNGSRVPRKNPSCTPHPFGACVIKRRTQAR
jgi:hypothetical protein